MTDINLRVTYHVEISEFGNGDSKTKMKKLNMIRILL